MVDGEKMVELQQNEIEIEAVKWRHAIILYVVGDSPSIGTVERFIATYWNFAAKPKVYYHNNDCFVVRFTCMEDRDVVLYSSPYTINNIPLIVKPWSGNFDLDKEVLSTILLWVRLPDLPLSYWENVTSSKIGSGIGKPIYANECTTSIYRISYARILVEMNVTRELPTSIRL
ncbi:uncharacterized protein [Nicotiana tomentosiformis]|uniref:uncharacterized protein n=1 Tax=Nicotiana tomentosiformis TaxID=4098 RepID=UPI00051AFA28|nr:uncharacterized protein LOC104093030 [Nicotiana tomentosiformis]